MIVLDTPTVEQVGAAESLIQPNRRMAAGPPAQQDTVEDSPSASATT